MGDIFNRNKINLGLDLQGGSHLLLEVDFDSYMKQMLYDNIDAIKGEFRRQKIRSVPRLKKDSAESEYYVYAIAKDSGDAKKIAKAIGEVNPDFDVKTDNLNVRATLSESSLNRVRAKLLQQSMEIVQRRINETGAKEPIIQAEGRNRILVQVPGVQNPDELKTTLGKTARMTFHFVDTAAMGSDTVPPGTVRMPDMGNPFMQYVVERKVMLGGDALADATVTYQEGKPAVGFRLNAMGTRRFADITKNNVGRVLAVVLDDEVITAPRINGVIPGGSGVITGDFTVESASQIALLLRAGALPAPLKIIEERTVGPSLGQDSIQKGTLACVLGLVLTALFMLLVYRKFGFFADLALLANLMIILAALSLFNATLTLPGIAGLVLTLGMAIDSNVLVFERMREELENGKNAMQSIENGFEFALSSIVDANLTSLIISVALYMFGSGAVRGFALVLGIGILSTIFSALVINKIIIGWWANRYRPKKLWF